MSTDQLNDLKKSMSEPDPTTDPKYKKFFANFAVSTVGIILFVAFGSIGLYFSKVAASKILPTNIDFKPYTCTPDNNPEKKPETIMMNLVREFPLKGLGFLLGMPAISKYCQEAKFDEKTFDKSFKGTRMRNLWEAQDDDFNKAKGTEASNMDRWKSESMNRMISAGFQFIQTIFGGLSGMNETLMMLLFGLIGSIFFPIFMIVNICTSLWAHISALGKKGIDGSLHTGVSWLKRKTRAENGETDFSEPPPSIYKMLGLVSKKEPTDISWAENIMFVLKMIVFYLGFIIYFMVSSLLISPIYTTFWTIAKTAAVKYKVKLNDDFSPDESGGFSKLKGIGDFIRDSFAYKRTYLVMLSIINLLMQANVYLGTYYFAAIFISIVLAIVFCDIFVSKTSPNDNTMIQLDTDNTDINNEEDKLDEEDEADDCEKNADAIKKIQDKIDQLAFTDGKSLYNLQTKVNVLLKQSYLCCNDKIVVGIDGKYTTKQLEDLQKMPEFQKLNDDFNNLAKQYFNGADFGKRSLLLDTSDPLEIQVQKLNAQLKYLLKYNIALQTAYDKCNQSLEVFEKAGKATPRKPERGLAVIDASNYPGKNFFTLMSKIQEGEKYIYKVRPNVVDIITSKINENKSAKALNDASAPPANAKLSTNAPTPTVASTEPNLALTAKVPQDNSILARIGLKNNKNNLKYNEVFMPLETMIAELMTTIFGNKNIFIDMVISPDAVTNIMENFIIKMNEDLITITDRNDIFGNFLSKTGVTGAGVTGAGLMRGGSRKNHSRRNIKHQVKEQVHHSEPEPKQYNIRLV